ncbi:MAG: PEP-CTERM sorting domain-containing protein [Phycisphaerae bacterium]|nr:PEP-CTERM sorting domain-containing protein [Phycisphaerae bacterium]
MSRHVFFCCTLVIALIMISHQAAFGWGGPTHSALTTKTFDDPVVSPLLGGIDQGAIEGYIGEPGDWQDGQWDNVEARAYVSGMSSPNGKDWDSLDETTRLKYMTHNVADVCVPIGHSPACYDPGGYSHTINEGILELQVSAWGSYPSVAGTTSYTHNRNGHSYNFTGNINQVLDEAYDAIRDNMTWFKSTKHFWGHYPEDNSDAGWNGTTIALMLQRAMMVDYFLSKEDVYMEPDTLPTGSAGGVITFDESNSYDPDSVYWNSNGTYSQKYGIYSQGIQYFLYDFNGDVPSGGAWDYMTTDEHLEFSVNDLISFGVPTNQWSGFWKAGVDNEGNYGYAHDWMYLSTGGAPEPASLSLLAVGALALVRKRRKR